MPFKWDVESLVVVTISGVVISGYSAALTFKFHCAGLIVVHVMLWYTASAHGSTTNYFVEKVG